MKNTDTFLISYATLAFSTVTVLSFFSLDRIELYLALFIIEFFAASELTSPFDKTESRRKNTIGILLLVLFATVIAGRMLELLG